MRTRTPLRLTIAIAAALVPLAVSAAIRGHVDLEAYPLFTGVLVLLFAVWAIGAVRLLVDFPRRLRAAARPPAAVDGPTVLYLRSFADDARFDLVKASARRLRLRFASTRDFEQVVVDALGQFARVAAIGNPGDLLPPLGAARDYVDHATWQDEVRARVETADLIVAVLGKSPGFAWELDLIRRRGLLPFTILLVPPVGLVELHARWAVLCDALGAPHFSAPPPADVVAVCFDWDAMPELSTSELMRRKRHAPVVASTDNYAVPLAHLVPALQRRRRYGETPPLSVRVHRTDRARPHATDVPDFLPASDSFEPPEPWRP